MNAASFNSILANPETLAASHTQDLQEIVKEYPYFQSAKALYLKALKNNESYLYNDVLKVTAAYTTDRSVLFEFITSDAFTQKAIAQAAGISDLSEANRIFGMSMSEFKKQQALDQTFRNRFARAMLLGRVNSSAPIRANPGTNRPNHLESRCSALH